MSRHIRLALVLFTVVALTGAFIGPAGSAAEPGPAGGQRLRLLSDAAPAQTSYAPGRILVKFRAGTKIAPEAVLAEAGGESLRELAGLGVLLVGVAPGAELTVAARLAADPSVLYAEPDYIYHAAGIATTPNDPYYADYQWNLPHINADDAWNTTTGSTGVIIAVIDTGVDLTHPDLASKIVSGYDFVHNDSDASDDEGHGTHVASLAAAASNNNEGIAGVSWGAKIMPLKALDSGGSGSTSDIADALRWAADHGADIANLSLGGSSGSSTLQDAINYAYSAGVLLIAASGNEYLSGNPTTYPAAYTHVLAVAATNDFDGHASYSNSGSYVDVAAPGGDPSSSYDSNPDHWIVGAYWRGSGYDYAWLAGTSQATPQVAGLAALLLSVNPSLTNDQVESLIRSTAVDVGTVGRDDFAGDGRIDVAAAVTAASGGPTATPTRTVTSVPGTTNTPTATATRTSTPTATKTPTRTSSPVAISTPTATPTRTNTPLPGTTPTATNTATTGPTPTATPSSVFTRPARPIGDVKVNDDAGTAGQGSPVIATDRLGNAVAVWKDLRSGNNDLSYAFLPSFVGMWSENSPIPGTQMAMPLGDPAVALGPRGEIVIAWHDSHDGDPDVYVSRRDPSSGAWSGPTRVSSDLPTSAQQRSPDVAIGPDGAVIVVWEEERSGNPDVFWARYWPATGVWLAPLRVHLDATGAQVQPAVAVDKDGNAYAAWVDRRGPQPVIVVAQLPAGGLVWGAPTVVGGSFPAGSNPNAPDIAVDGANVVHVVWEDSRDAAHGADTYHSLRRPGSANWTAAARVNDDTGNFIQRTPRLAAVGGMIAAVWEDNRAANPDIFLAWWIPDQNRWTTNRRVNSDVGSANQTQPDVALDRGGNAYVIWTDYRAPSASDIFFRFIPSTERFKTYLPAMAR